MKTAKRQPTPTDDIKDDYEDLESKSSFSSPSEVSPSKIKEYDPVKRAEGRKRQLPASRYEASWHTSSDHSANQVEN